MADEKKAAKQYDSIIDAILDEREPDWKQLDLSEAQKSGDEWLDRSHQYVDTEFEDEIAESASRHTPVWKNSARAYEERIAEKEAAAPRVSAVQADWHKDARRDTDAYSTQMGDNDSLINELTMSLEKAQSSGNLKENSADKKEVSDAQIFKYVKDLLNQGMAPSKVAKKLEKIAEIELFNHQSATDYLQRNAGLMGLAYLEPNSFMDKSSPTYGRTASEFEWSPAGRPEIISGKCRQCGGSNLEPRFPDQGSVGGRTEVFCKDCNKVTWTYAPSVPKEKQSASGEKSTTGFDDVSF